MKHWERKELGRRLRKQGLSYKEICERVHAAKSTVSRWCKDIELTSKQIAQLEERRKHGGYRGSLKGSKSNQSRRAKEIEKIREIARSEFSLLSVRDFKIAGLMLYWAEGAKQHYVDFANSHPAMIKFMMKWFREACSVPEYKFRAQLHIHTGQDERRVKEYWSGITNIPLTQFEKSCVKREGSGHRKNKLYNGTIKIRICDSNLLHKIIGWTEGLNISKIPSINYKREVLV